METIMSLTLYPFTGIEKPKRLPYQNRNNPNILHPFNTTAHSLPQTWGLYCHNSPEHIVADVSIVTEVGHLWTCQLLDPPRHSSGGYVNVTGGIERETRELPFYWGFHSPCSIVQWLNHQDFKTLPTTIVIEVISNTWELPSSHPMQILDIQSLMSFQWSYGS